VVDWVATTSWVAVLPDEERAGVLGRVAAESEPVEVPYETWVYWCRARP
jgi:hypothetical protein